MLYCDNLLAGHSFHRQQILHPVLFKNIKKYSKYDKVKTIFNHKLQEENNTMLYFISLMCNNQFE
jgi:hypothetical protein